MCVAHVIVGQYVDENTVAMLLRYTTVSAILHWHSLSFKFWGMDAVWSITPLVGKKLGCSYVDIMQNIQLVTFCSCMLVYTVCSEKNTHFYYLA